MESISNRRVVSIREKINTTGNEPLRLICDDYESYFVKNHKLINPAASMINEVLCHFLLKQWNINTPDIALITLEAATIREDYGSRHKPLYYDRLAFGSKEFEGAFDISQFVQIKGKVDFKKYYRAEMFAHIGLFDMWVDNDDRGPELKNLMLFEDEERFHFLAIDQAAAFRSGAYDTLKYNEFYPIEDNFLLQSQFFKSLKRFLKADKEWLRKEEEKYYLCIIRCEREFPEMVLQIPPEWGFTKELQALVSDFLFNDKRNKQVFTEYLRLCQ